MAEDEVRAKDIDMGHELSPVYHALWNEVAWLHAKWNQYRQLYARSPDRVDLLNKLAGHFFGVVQRTLYDDILLHLARVTDPRKSAGNDNLTLQRLPDLTSDHPALASELERLIEAARKATDAARAERNKRIAHTDLALALDSTFDPPPSRADVEAALRAVRAVLHRLEKHYWGSETGYQHVIRRGGDGDALVHYLVEGVRAEERQMQRLRQGQPLPEDFEPQEEV